MSYNRQGIQSRFGGFPSVGQLEFRMKIEKISLLRPYYPVGDNIALNY